ALPRPFVVPFPPAAALQLVASLAPGPGVAAVALASTWPPLSIATLPATRKTIGLSPTSCSTCPPVSVRPERRTTMTVGPPLVVCDTLLVQSSVAVPPHVSPAIAGHAPVDPVELMVVVPAAVQLHEGDDA